MTMRPAWGRIGLGLLGLVVLAVLIYMGPAPTPGKSDWALRMLATALSILAGILLAVITLLGDPGGLYLGNWRVARSHRRDIQRTFKPFYAAFLGLSFGNCTCIGYSDIRGLRADCWNRNLGEMGETYCVEWRVRGVAVVVLFACGYSQCAAGAP